MPEVKVRSSASLLFLLLSKPCWRGRKEKIRGLELHEKKTQTIFRLCNTCLITISYNFCSRKVGILVLWWMLCMPPCFCSFISWNEAQLYRCSVLIRALFGTVENPEIRRVVHGRPALPNGYGKAGNCSRLTQPGWLPWFADSKLIHRRNVWEGK